MYNSSNPQCSCIQFLHSLGRLQSRSPAPPSRQDSLELLFAQTSFSLQEVCLEQTTNPLWSTPGTGLIPSIQNPRHQVGRPSSSTQGCGSTQPAWLHSPQNRGRLRLKLTEPGVGGGGFGVSPVTWRRRRTPAEADRMEKCNTRICS